VYEICSFVFDEDFIYAVNKTSAQASGYAYLASGVLHSCSKEIINETNNQDSMACWQEDEVIQTLKLVYYVDCQEKYEYNQLVYSPQATQDQVKQCSIRDRFLEKANEVIKFLP